MPPAGAEGKAIGEAIVFLSAPPPQGKGGAINQPERARKRSAKTPDDRSVENSREVCGRMGTRFRRREGKGVDGCQSFRCLDQRSINAPPRTPTTPPMIANGIVPAIAVPNAAIPMLAPNHPPPTKPLIPPIIFPIIFSFSVKNRTKNFILVSLRIKQRFEFLCQR